MGFKGQYPLCRELTSWGSSRAWRLQGLSAAGFEGFAEEVAFRFCSGSGFSGLYCRIYFLYLFIIIVIIIIIYYFFLGGGVCQVLMHLNEFYECE